MYLYPVFLSSIALLVIIQDVRADDDNSDEYRVMIGDWIQETMTCKKEMDDSGVEMKLMTCLAFYEGGKAIDPKLKEYDSCKALLACVMKKAGVMSSDGTSLIKDKMLEVSSIFDYKYKGIKDEFNNNIWPACEKTTGKEGEMAYNFLECVFKKSAMAKKLKDKFFAFFHAQQDDKK
ncbi:uncharacterized protein LOC111054996 [Nilaparvata lugens]|uniref:uncharacterized protein LOC111054996 n=1 Tax=Nilaparvata lugens TaxID=108931 RepID=UPI00193EAC63|nr:uncharacterized protein LOC111054996 [Nilaparvata lugens]